MAKFLFVVPPFLGHINPTISLGTELINREHKVAWTGITNLDKKHFPEKGEYFFLEKEYLENKDEVDRIIEMQKDGEFIKGLEILKFALEGTFIPFARIMMPGVLSVVDSFKPDVIINDGITFAGAFAAYIRNIPYATTNSSPPEVMGDASVAPKVAEWADSLILNLQKHVGITENKKAISSEILNLVFTSKEFAGVRNVSEHMKFVGPALNRPNNFPFDWGLISSIKTRKIFVSIGTVLTNSREAFFNKLIEAFEDKPVTIIAVADPSIINRWPSNFIVKKYLPQLEILKHVDAIISHGGFNSTNEAIYNNVPILVIPIAYDQFYNASLIENAGCGIRLKYHRLRINDIQNSIDELVNNPKYKIQTEKISHTFVEAGGTNEAVRLLETLLKN